MREAPFLPRRHSVRLPTFDYSQPCVCFLTICAQDGRSLFGKVVGPKVALNALGRIVESCWLGLPTHFPAVELSEHAVMPNHVHGIVILRPTSGVAAGEAALAHAPRREMQAKHPGRAQHAVPLRLGGSVPPRGTHRFGPLVPGSVSTIVRSFKSATTKRIRDQLHSTESGSMGNGRGQPGASELNSCGRARKLCRAQHAVPLQKASKTACPRRGTGSRREHALGNGAGNSRAYKFARSEVLRPNYSVRSTLLLTPLRSAPYALFIVGGGATNRTTCCKRSG